MVYFIVMNLKFLMSSIQEIEMRDEKSTLYRLLLFRDKESECNFF